MATPASDTERSSAPWSLRCRECSAPLADDQRYCVECGSRRGPLPPTIARLIDPARVEPGPVADPAGSEWDDLLSRLTTPVAAVAVMALLAVGVLVGSAVSPTQPTGASAPVIVAVSPPTATTPAPAAPAASPSPTPPATTPPPPTTPVPTVTTTTPTTTTPQTTPTTPAPATSTLPPVKHVFLIVLSEHGYTASFGPNSQAPYLSKTLVGQGELLQNYYAVTGGELANEIALLSGQGPNPQTAANCPTYTDVTPGTAGSQGQVNGSGCVYPRTTLTLADQLTADGRTWKSYVEDIGNGGAGQPPTCRHPPLGAADPKQAPAQGDAYVTWRNPFVYFHSLIDTPSCSTSSVGLDQLAGDLKVASKAPSFAYIVPNRCHDGAEQPCAPGQPAGLPAADAFLRTVVPEIEASPAYKDGGLIAITFDQAPQSGPNADASGCCNTPSYPNLPASSAPTATTTAPSSSTTPASTTPSPTTTAPTGASTTTTPSSASTTPTTTTTTPGSAATPPGGGRVGLLLISSFVKPGSVNGSDDYNHFSLLRSIEDLFSLKHLGFADAPGLLGFDKTVYNGRRS
jgi:hypothetical protein